MLSEGTHRCDPCEGCRACAICADPRCRAYADGWHRVRVLRPGGPEEGELLPELRPLLLDEGGEAKSPTCIVSRYTFFLNSLEGITVERRDFVIDSWAVMYLGCALNRSMTWDWEPQPSERDSRWFAEHRFPLTVALEMAEQALSTIREAMEGPKDAKPLAGA